MSPLPCFACIAQCVRSFDLVTHYHEQFQVKRVLLPGMDGIWATSELKPCFEANVLSSLSPGDIYRLANACHGLRDWLLRDDMLHIWRAAALRYLPVSDRHLVASASVAELIKLSAEASTIQWHVKAGTCRTIGKLQTSQEHVSSASDVLIELSSNIDSKFWTGSLFDSRTGVLMTVPNLSEHVEMGGVHLSKTKDVVTVTEKKGTTPSSTEHWSRPYQSPA